MRDFDLVSWLLSHFYTYVLPNSIESLLQFQIMCCTANRFGYWNLRPILKGFYAKKNPKQNKKKHTQKKETKTTM